MEIVLDFIHKTKQQREQKESLHNELKAANKELLKGLGSGAQFKVNKAIQIITNLIENEDNLTISESNDASPL